ncbi:uncharacterized protein LY89DRAFT_226162 [Mollisia scopiformis]|uniref:Uncharacterized protein n=1 Tax=Mollisia scopiformis TaxID=149040 RepID=A0A194WUY6_MOLSC|nr:uncharacterized protein LY89DRAFT_226162 [Mollisia scopiformis]KUJ11474.1 hypothetical protein LY89DRAFT_226162 [Mollisia scopiformis]
MVLGIEIEWWLRKLIRLSYRLESARAGKVLRSFLCCKMRGWAKLLELCEDLTCFHEHFSFAGFYLLWAVS